MSDSAPKAAVAPNRVELLSRHEVVRCPHWQHAFAGRRKDHRYYEIVEDTICPELDYRYFALRDEAGEVFAIQPLLLLDQDLLGGMNRRIRSAANIIRLAWPRFLRLRALMLGCAAGEGHLDTMDEASRRAIAQLLAASLLKHARELNARLVVFKEFPAMYRDALECLQAHGYRRIPSLPAVRLNIGYANFDEYVERALSRNMRMHLRRNLRASEQPPQIDLQVVDDIGSLVDEAYPLYRQVYDRSHLWFEKLTKEFFCELGRRMPDRTRFFLWRRDGRLVAFSTCMIEGDTFYAEYVGLDYAVALDLHLYFRVFRDEVSWAMANGYRWYHSGTVQYDPKLHLRFRLDPLDLYVRHTSGIFNALLKPLLPLLEPTRYDRTLHKFPDYAALGGKSGSAAKAY